MFNYLGRTRNSYLKVRCFNKFNLNFYSVLYFNKDYYNLKTQKEQQKKIKPIQQQYRFFSQNSIDKQYGLFFDKITSSEISCSLRNILTEVHDDFCIPWWGCIALTTLIVKFSFTLATGFYQQHLGAKIKLSKVELRNVMNSIHLKTLEMGKKQKWNPGKHKQYFNAEMSKAWSDIVVKNNCHPFKIYILSHFQIPVWLLLSLNFRKLTIDPPSEVASQLSSEGPFWSTNLLLPDSSLVCPLIIGISTLSLCEMNNLMQENNQRLAFKVSKNILRLVSVLGFLISMFVPSAVSFYWAMSTLYSLCQFLVFLSPRVKRFCRIPKTPFDSERPYRNIYLNLKKKFSLIKI